MKMPWRTSFGFDDEFKRRVQNQLTGTETISQFCYRAAEEKLNRLETKDKAARERIYRKDVELFTPLIEGVFIKLMRDYYGEKAP
jgi:hypothetical protein